jgi:hypothetical protein
MAVRGQPPVRLFFETGARAHGSAVACVDADMATFRAQVMASDELKSAPQAPALSTPAPSRRLILLGASNLTRSFATVVEMARATWGEPVEIMAAMGHGRSYGQDSRVLGRKISGIFPCALWQDLQNRPPLPTAALVTDIGNDLLYGVPPDRLLDWVEKCLDRLAEAGAATIVTQMPVGSIESLGEARFRFFRRMFFPRSRLTLNDAKSLVRELNEQLVRLGDSRKISVIPVCTAWYGLDPIHLRRRILSSAWSTMLTQWRASNEPLTISKPSLRRIAYLATLAPWERSLFGVRRRAAQPSGRLPDGTTISLY